MESQAAASAAGPMPRFHVYRGFLSEEENAGLLAFVLANEAAFEEAQLFGKGGDRIDPTQRVSRRSSDLGPYRALIRMRIAALLPDMFARTGTRAFEPEHYEMDVVAHGDGAHLARHRDILIGEKRAQDPSGKGDRLLSGVYYFHRQPRAFAGGALRLYPFMGGAEGGEWADVEPEQNSLVVFPSWAPHEVLRVSVPSRAFADSRFAVNVWLRRTLA